MLAGLIKGVSLWHVFKAIDEDSIDEEGDPLDDEEFLDMEYEYSAALALLLMAAFRLAKKSIEASLAEYNAQATLASLIKRQFTKELGIDLMKQVRDTIGTNVETIFGRSRGKLFSGVLTPQELKAIEYLKSLDAHYCRLAFNRYSANLYAIVDKAFEGGGSLVEMVERALSEAEKFLKSQTRRYRQIASTSANKARNFARVFGFSASGVKFVRFVAVIDDRTTLMCRSLHGKVYAVSSMLSYVNGLIDGGEMNLEKSAPFHSDKEFYKGGKQMDPEDIAALIGVPVPPLHHRCRSTLEEA